MKKTFWKNRSNDKKNSKAFHKRLDSLDRKMTKFAAGFYSCLFLIILFIIITILFLSMIFAIFHVA